MAFQHAAAAAACPQVLRVRRPPAAREVATLRQQVASAARNAAGVPGPGVVSDVLRPVAVTIRTVGVLVGERAAVRDAEQLRLFVVPKLSRVAGARHGCQRVVGVPGVLLSKVGRTVYYLAQPSTVVIAVRTVV